MDTVKINVGGTVFLTNRQIILNIPESKLATALATNEHFDSSTGMFFFDRRPSLFEPILSAHRDGEVHLPINGCGSELFNELEFWNIPDNMVAACCIGKVKSALTERQIARDVAEEICSDPDRSLEIREGSTGWRRKRMDAWLFMEFPVSSRLAKVMFVVLFNLSDSCHPRWSCPSVRPSIMVTRWLTVNFAIFKLV
jgi:hypothetical protein